MIKKVLNFVILLILFWFGLAFGETYYIDNGNIKIGIKKEWGGAISELRVKINGRYSDNLVDDNDRGRLIQLALFGNTDYCKHHQCCDGLGSDNNPTRFNPTQGGSTNANCEILNSPAEVIFSRNEIGWSWSAGATKIPVDWETGIVLQDKARMSMQVTFPARNYMGFIIESDARVRNLTTYESITDPDNKALQELPVFYLVYSKFDKVWKGGDNYNVEYISDIEDFHNGVEDIYGNDCKYVIIHIKNTNYWFGFLTELSYTNLSIGSYEVRNGFRVGILHGDSVDGTGKTINIKRIILSTLPSNAIFHTTTYCAFGTSPSDVKNKLNNMKNSNSNKELRRVYFQNTHNHAYFVNTQIINYLYGLNDNIVQVEGSLGKVCTSGSPLFEFYTPSWQDSFVTNAVEANSLIWSQHPAHVLGAYIGREGSNKIIDRWINLQIKDHLLTPRGSDEEDYLSNYGYQFENGSFSLN